MPLTLHQQRAMTPMARIKSLIEANRDSVRNHEDFDTWVMGSKERLFRRRAAEVLHTMRIMRLVAQETGGNPGWEVARQMLRLREFLNKAKEERDLFAGRKLAPVTV